MNSVLRSIPAVAFLFVGSLAAFGAPKPTDQIEDDPKLPRVLLIGDSITMGYTLPLREALAGKANVHHPDENCGPSPRIVEHLDHYLGDKPWDVIHLNCGIHDITHRGGEKNGFLAPEKGGKIYVPIEEYRKNLETIVERLKKTGATIFWRASTPIAPGVPHRIPADIDRYNAVAKEIMEKNGIQIVDLNVDIEPKGPIKHRKDGVHYEGAGYKKMAAKLAPVIETALAKRRTSPRAK